MSCERRKCERALEILDGDAPENPKGGANAMAGFYMKDGGREERVLEQGLFTAETQRARRQNGEERRQRSGKGGGGAKVTRIACGSLLVAVSGRRFLVGGWKLFVRDLRCAR